MIVTIRYSDHALLLDKLEQLGVPIRRSTPERIETGTDMNGNPYSYTIPAVTYAPEEEIAVCSTPQLVTTNGIVRSVILTDEQYALLPGVTSPDFLLDWTEEDIDADENPLPWPTYTVNGVDMNGNPITWQQGAGAFA